tara:strand:+ start:287 stop:712 length:426 start_codon:yes stop_codon:yes gene_type:complete
MSTRRKEQRFFRRITPDWETATEAFPELPDIEIVFDEAAGTEGRQFAYFDSETESIGFSPRVIREPAHRQRGLFRHELGHYVHHFYGRDHLQGQIPEKLAESDEVLADQIAGFIYGEPILYDDETVQSIRHGEPKRPDHLG